MRSLETEDWEASNCISDRLHKKCRFIDVGDSILTISMEKLEKLEMVAKRWPEGAKAWKRRQGRD